MTLTWSAKLKALGRPFTVALVVHIFIVLLLLLSFTAPEEDILDLEEAIPVVIVSQIARSKREPPKTQATEEPVAREEGMMLEDRTVEESVQQDQEAQEEMEEALAKKKLPMERSAADLLHELLFEGLEEEIEAEARNLEELNERQQTQVYIAAITKSIENRWSRPLNARSGMMAKLRIEIVPTGEVVSVSLLEGSGFPVFDRSAEAATRKASPLPVPEDAGLFERNFRSLTIIFNPTDLER